MENLQSYIDNSKKILKSSFNLDSLIELRADHQLKLENTLIPNRYIEDWKYTNLKTILNNNYLSKDTNEQAPVVENNSDYYHLYTVNGKLDLKNSDDIGLKVTPIYDTDNSEVSNLLKEDSYYKNDFASTLNFAFLENGLIIEVPKNKTVDKPIKIHHQVSGDNSHHNMTNFIIMGESSKADILETISSTENVFVNISTSIQMSANSNLGHNVIQTTSKESLVIYSLNSKLAKDANYKHIMFNTGALISRSNLYFNLTEPGAIASTHGLYALNEKQHHDTMSFINHGAANTESHQLYKGILDQESRGVFTGRIFIDKDSQQVNANQLNKNLLLSKKAQINSRPQLEIYADDVKCCHGSTTGQLSDEELFYFESRGIKKDKARKILARAFAYDVVLKIDNSLIRNTIKEHLLNKEIVS